MRFLAVIFLCFFIFTDSVYAKDELKGFDTHNLEEASKENSGLSFSKIFYKVIEGDADEVIEDVYKSIKNGLYREIKDNSVHIRSIIIISLLCGILNTVAVDLKDKAVSELVFYAGQLLILTLAISAFKESIALLKECADNIINIITAAAPFMLSIAAASGRAVSGVVLTVTTGVVSQIIKGIVIPLITIATLVKTVNIISDRDMLNKMSELFKDITGYIIKGGGYLFIFLTSFERISAGALNKFVGGSLKSAVGAVPVIGSIIEGGVDIAANAAGTVATGSGIAIVIILVSSAAVPVIKILVITAIYKVLSAVAEPICDKGTAEIIDCVGEGCKMILSCLVMVLFMFVTSVLVMLGGIT